MRKLVWLPLAVLLPGLLAVPTACEGNDTQGATGGSAAAGANGGAGGDLPDASPDGAGGAHPDAEPPPPVTCEPGPGQPYYVSPTGDDAADGSEQAPWQTLAKAADAAQAGDTVYLLAGTWGERLVPPRSGTDGSPITFMGAPDNASPAVLDGTGVDVGSGGLVQVQAVSFIQICGLTVRNSAYDGVKIDQNYVPEVPAEHILVSGLTVERSGQTAIKSQGAHFVVIDGNHTNGSVSSGVGVWGSSDVVVSHNEVVNARDDEVNGHEESVSIASTERFDVFENEIYLDGNVGFLGNEGIDVKESSRDGRVHHNFVHDYPETGGSIYLDAWTAGLDGTPTLSTVDVYANLVLRAGGIAVGSERGGTVEHLRIFNNIVMGVSWTGIILSNTGHGSGGDGPRRDVQILEQHGPRLHGQRRRRHLCRHQQHPEHRHPEQPHRVRRQLEWPDHGGHRRRARRADRGSQPRLRLEALLPGLSELRRALRLARQRHRRSAAGGSGRPRLPSPARLARHRHGAGARRRDGRLRGHGSTARRRLRPRRARGRAVTARHRSWLRREQRRCNVLDLAQTEGIRDAARLVRAYLADPALFTGKICLR